MLQNLFKFDSELVLIIDRTQWQNTNILMISVPWNQRTLPIYWHILSHKGASNLTKKNRNSSIYKIIKRLENYDNSR